MSLKNIHCNLCDAKEKGMKNKNKTGEKHEYCFHLFCLVHNIWKILENFEI